MKQHLKHPSNQAILQIKIILILACLIPLLRLIVAGLSHQLGADPVETLTRSTGIWTLNFLFLTVAVTPLRKLTGWHWLVRLRRAIALYAFFYACLHFATYLVFDQYFDWSGIAKDITKRPYITAGFFAFVLLIPLALTSTNGMMKLIGGHRWQILHRLTYPIVIAGVLHYLWLVKRDITYPGIYAIVLCVLLCARLLAPRKVVAKHSGVPPMTGMGGGIGSRAAPQRSQK
ncbi:sulfite oxidase heme-binding subunit YedZ [Methylomagnum sp.]